MHFVFAFLYLKVCFVNCLSEDDLSDTNRHSSSETNTSQSAEPNSTLACPSNRCVRKCCKATEIYNWLENYCSPDHTNELKNANWSAEYSKFDVIYDSRCPMQSIEVQVNEYRLFSNGSIDHENFGMLNFQNYCVDYSPEWNAIRPTICIEIYESDILDAFPWAHYLNLSGLIITISFLIITLSLYIATPKLRENTHDLYFMCHLLSLIIGFSSLLRLQFMSPENVECAFIGE